MPLSTTLVTELFTQLSSPETQKNFFDQVSDNVKWWIVGNTPMSGTYNTKQDFQNATLEILNGKVLSGTLSFRPVNVIVSEGSNWATAELEAIDATCRNGRPYNMRYCWLARFGDSGLIEEVRAYLDTELLSKAIAENS